MYSTRTALTRLILVSMFGAGALALACSGGDNGNGAGNATTATVAVDSDREPGNGSGANGGAPDTPEPDAASDSGSDPTPATHPEPITPSDDGTHSEFQELIGEFKQREYHVEYKSTVSTSGQQLDGVIGRYQLGESLRSDFSYQLEGELFAGSTIRTPDATYICSDAAGLQSCLGMPPGGPTIIPDLSARLTSQMDAILENSDNVAVQSAGRRTIAGGSARCFEFSSVEGTGLTCISDDGVMLLIEVDFGQGTMRMEATSYGTSVSESDFEPPFPVTNIDGVSRQSYGIG
ncbi:MAG TPA: hypothetical protein QGF35_01780 [Dehalococcoidia bacterium]|nr:hypothetical protein [Dehalococcoidia bacterium]